MELMLIFILLMVTLEGIGKVNRNHGNHGQGGLHSRDGWLLKSK